jgi:hypothetical protein
MRSLDAIIDQLLKREDCRFRPATGLPILPPGLLLPPDLAAFYSRFSEAILFGTPADPRCHIQRPDNFVEIRIAIYNQPTTVPQQRSWFALADVLDGDYIAIDCHRARLGYCYDVFHETASDLDYCKIVARSFSEFMDRVAEAGDEAWWLHDRFEMYGYADTLPYPDVR